MISRKASWLMAGLMTLALGLTALPAAAADTAPTAPANGALTPETLGKLLTDMGLDPKKINDNVYEVVVKRSNYVVYFRFQLSSDKSRLWVTSYLESIDDVSKVPADVMAKLLEWNFKASPSFFYFYNPADAKKPALRYLYIARPVDNRNITASFLRLELDTMFDTVKNTQSLWKASEWKAGPAVGPTKN
jgi:hypothetical protein